jgi:hypothetical protein
MTTINTFPGGSQVISGQQHKRPSTPTSFARHMPKFAITCFYNMEPWQYHNKWTMMLSNLLKPAAQPWEHNPVARSSNRW